MKTGFVVTALLLLPQQLMCFLVSSGAKTNRLHSSSSRESDFNDRLVVLETEMKETKENHKELSRGIKDLSKKMDDGNEKMSKDLKDLSKELKDDIKDLSKEMKEANEKMSKEMKEDIKDLSKEMKEANEKISKDIKDLSKEIKDINNKFIPLYVFLAVFSTATGMANFKDFVAFFK